MMNIYIYALFSFISFLMKIWSKFDHMFLKKKNLVVLKIFKNVLDVNYRTNRYLDTNESKIRSSIGLLSNLRSEVNQKIGFLI